ncbi:hypothetical protein M501DRAFT_1010836 [Patellaria atrata CBS 101060]|uniref:Protein kinase domain-containing protein n=1 Tax=Patellaria atrata CBS 101060 TaxID=1346257 RepID=A0A9P4SDH3_9PEZI|nr:hypothetical protein M501DRAFT_1010836 [Patellaria atrata CBS 101060]
MASSIVGKSGRVYVQDKVLQHHRQDHKLSVFMAVSGTKSFVFKRVPWPSYDLSLSLVAEFFHRLRMHIGCYEKEGGLVYSYLRDTLLAIMQEDPDFPLTERKKILRRTREAIQELHGKDWIHIDVKPDNIFVNWTCDEESNKTVSDAALGDFDIVFKSEGGEARVTKASGIFSFGLVCIYALGGGELLLLNGYKELAKHGIKSEQETLTRHFSYFGPNCRHALKGASGMAEDSVREQPLRRFERWGEDLVPEAQNMISRMTNLDPAGKITIDQVLTHRWW